MLLGALAVANGVTMSSHQKFSFRSSWSNTIIDTTKRRGEYSERDCPPVTTPK